MNEQAGKSLGTETCPVVFCYFWKEKITGDTHFSQSVLQESHVFVCRKPSGTKILLTVSNTS